jgi:hypothetical protein
MRNCLILFFSVFAMSAGLAQGVKADADTFNGHEVQLDAQNKIVSWIQPQSRAYDKFLRDRWNFVKTKAPMSPGPAPRSNYPQYYFYCAYRVKDGQLELDTWMNDIGERLPNWTESARLHYAYTGDTMVMEIVKGLLDYSLAHGTTPSNFAWPNFPYTTTNAGDTIFHGFTSAKRFALHEVQVDHAGDIGLAYYRMYQYTGDSKYKTAAVNVANTLALHVRTGSATQSPWPYRVIMDSGKITAEYGANWFGCYTLLDELQKAGFGKPSQYRSALAKVRTFILAYPMKTGYWTDGHTDTDVKSHTYKSNMSASNAKLYLFDHPEFDPAWKADIPSLIKWTEDNFITRSAPGEPSNLWGANIVGEQDEFLFKMDYQTARYGAECARWFAISGDSSYREKAFRSLNWVTYCSDSNGLAFESPLSKNISSWWSDCYGECPRMFYHALAAVPEWAPENEDHILYSTGLVKNVLYANKNIRYTAPDRTGTEYVKTSFKPSTITLNGKSVAHEIKIVSDGGYEVIIKRSNDGQVVIAGN